MSDLTDLRARAEALLGNPPEGDQGYAAPAEDDEHDDDWFATIRGAGDFACRLGEPEDRTWCRDGAPVLQRLNDLHRLARDLLAALPPDPAPTTREPCGAWQQVNGPGQWVLSAPNVPKVRVYQRATDLRWYWYEPDELDVPAEDCRAAMLAAEDHADALLLAGRRALGRVK